MSIKRFEAGKGVRLGFGRKAGKKIKEVEKERSNCIVIDGS